MRHASKFGFLVLFAVAMSLSISACRLECGDDPNGDSMTCPRGTGTGNPAQPNLGSDPGFATTRLMSSVCMKLESCQTGLTFQQCNTAFLARSDIDAEVGLPEGAFATYQDAIAGEMSGAVRANDSSLQDCVSAIHELSCDSAEVMGAYRPDQNDPLAGLSSLFAPVCSSALEAF